jgi:hypothetical protein
MLKWLGCLTVPVALLVGIFMWVGSQTFYRPWEKTTAFVFAYGWAPMMLILGVICFYVPRVRLPTLALFLLGIVGLWLLAQYSRK